MKTFRLSLGALIAFAVLASAAEVVNIDKNGLALQGYDPVAYFTDGKPVKGSAQFTANYKGATYQFASAQHKQLFEQSPAKYEPQFGGFCGYAASINKLAPIEVEYFQVLHDRLILQHNKKAWDLWHKDVEGNLKKADANWPALSQQKAPAS
jgi:YHS domain-containing protein